VILNPYFWLGLLLWTALVGAGSYLKGARNAENAARAAHATALEQTIKQANENAVIDMMAAAEAEAARHKTRVEFKDRVVTVEKIIRENPQPAECNIPDDAVGLLNDITRAVNKQIGAKPDNVPAPAPAPQRKPVGVSAGLSGGA